MRSCSSCRRWRLGAWTLALAAGVAAAHADAAPPAANAPGTPNTPMERMIAEIQRDAARTASHTGVARIGETVLGAIRATPRDRFVLERTRPAAYANHPLPIGHGQTISQPFIVALMTQLLDVRANHRVLEIGTGSGYQAAVLAELVADVYTVEIVPELARSARDRLAVLGHDNIHVHAGDGWRGWPEHAPFDRVIVTAVGERVPPRLIEQLAEDGLLVMPVGPVDGYQELIVYDNRTGGTRRSLPVRFVPLTGGPAAPP